MKIVIDIPEDIYNEIKEGLYDKNLRKMAIAIGNGTPIPNGHGRLIDADALMEYCQNDKTKLIDCNDIARFPIVLGREE